jgi:hypothetical protein
MEVELTNLYTPPFGGVMSGEVFYTTKGYVSPKDRWTAVTGKFTPRDRPGRVVDDTIRNASFPSRDYLPGPVIPDVETDGQDHFENFIACVRSRSREDLHCEILDGHMSTALCHLANVSFHTGRKLVFDPDTETFPGDSEATAMLTRKYREPYVMPDEV